MSKYIGIDFGAANTRLCANGALICEPSLIAAEIYSEDIADADREYAAVGNDAVAVYRNTPGSVELIRPFFEDKTEDYSIIYEYVCQLLEKYSKDFHVKGAKTVICVPAGLPSAGLDSVREALYDMGAKAVGVVSSVSCAAIGAGIDAESLKKQLKKAPENASEADSDDDPVSSRMIIDMGADTVQFAVINNCGIVYSDYTYDGGTSCDLAVSEKIRQLSGASPDMREAERIKCSVGTAYPLTEEIYDTAVCKKMFSGLPCEVKITSDALRPTIFEHCKYIIDAIGSALEKISPQSAAGISKNGIILTGGGADMIGIAEFIRDFTEIETSVAERPEECTARGLEKMINDSEYMSLIDFS